MYPGAAADPAGLERFWDSSLNYARRAGELCRSAAEVRGYRYADCIEKLPEVSYRRSPVTTGHQFYVTHCTVANSVLNNPGFSVRAASSTDRALLDAAFQYPPYELPIDLWKELPAPTAAPRRLARTKHSSGGVWVVHSSYLEKDTVGRDRSYFSHLALLPSASPAEVLRSWSAGGWAKTYPP